MAESELGLLGEVAGRRVLEIGAGAAQCSRWLASRGRSSWPRISRGMLEAGLSLNQRVSDPRLAVPLVQCDATTLPFADAGFDVVFTAYGAVPFVADSAALMRGAGPAAERAVRVLDDAPVPWAFPRRPGPGGLTVAQESYFDRTPYVEADSDEEATYVEHHPHDQRPGGRSRLPVSCCATWSSPSGRSATAVPGAAGRPCEVALPRHGGLRV